MKLFTKLILALFAFAVVSSAYAEDAPPMLCNHDQASLQLLSRYAAHDTHGRVFATVKLGKRTTVKFIFSRLEWQDQVKALQLRGRSYSVARNSSRSSRLQTDWGAGSIYKKNGRLLLELTFPAKTKSAVQYYSVKIPLDDSRGSINRSPNFALSGKTCGDEAKGSLAAASSASLAGSYQADAATSSPVVYREYEIAADADAQYRSIFGSTSATTTRMSSVLNTVNAIYENTLGFHVQQRALSAQSSAAVYTVSSNPSVYENLLSAFQNHINSTGNLGAADVYFLFSGQTFGDGVVGLAYVGAACSAPDFSYGITQRLSDQLDPVIVAHEMGHTLGATHGVDVDHPTTGIMAPFVSNTQTFSAFSLDQIQSYVAGNGSCLASVNYGTPTPTPTPPPGSTPTPTPTSGSGGGGGGGGAGTGGGNPIAPPVSLSVKVRGKVFSGSFTVSQLIDGCSVTLRAGTTYFNARTGKIIDTGLISATSYTFTQTLTTKVKQLGSKDKRKVYIVAQHSCPGFNPTYSDSKNISPFRVSVKKVVSLKKWISLL
jgi:hypothetical protein